MLASSKTKVQGKGECLLGSVVGRVSRVVNGRAREGVALLLSKRVLDGVVEYREVSTRLMLVQAKFGGDVWFSFQCARSRE